MMESCPYCRQALKMMEQLREKDPRYRAVEVEMIDELRHPDIANRYDYYYVPTYYVDGKKLHEGVPTISAVQHVFEEALK